MSILLSELYSSYKYYILITDRNPRIFEDIALNIQKKLKEHNFRVDFLNTTFDSQLYKNEYECVFILLGCESSKLAPYMTNRNVIVVMLESMCRDYTNQHYYDTCNAISISKVAHLFEIWTHDISNINKLANMYPHVSSLHLIKINYSPHNDLTKQNYEKIYDIAFCGAMTDRRSIIIESLRQKGWNIFNPPYACWGNERDIAMAQSKICLIVDAYDNIASNDYVRLSYLLSNGAFVIYEHKNDPQRIENWDKYCIPTHYNDIISTTEKYLQDDMNREKLAKEFHENYKLVKYELPF